LRRTPAGFVLDFQEQQLRTVLSALSEAASLNVSLSNIPDQRITLRMGQAVTREGMVEVLRQISDQYTLKMTESGPLIRIDGPPPSRTTPQQTLAQQLAAQQALQQQQQVQLYTYRLKHAVAEQIAPVLTSLFTGGTSLGGGRGATTIVPNPGGGFQIITPQGPGGAAPPIPPGGAGGFNPQTGQPLGRGGNAGNVNIPGGGRGQAAQNAIANIQSQVQNAFQQAFGGALSGSSDIRIIAEASSNSLLIRATAQDYALIQQVLGSVDLRPLQVLIEVTIAEVQRTRDLNVGVSYDASHTPDGRNQPNVTGTLPSSTNPRDFIVQLTSGNGSVQYDIAIAALQARGDVRVLSLPVIIAQNNRQAVLNVGSSRPFVQVSQSVPLDPTSRVQTVQYIDVGTVLTITPTINPDGYVNLQVNQTDNSASNEIQFDAPIINKREATTQVFVRDGQTTVIGGLAGKTRDRQQTGIPFLSAIPLIGPYLFGSVVETDVTTELFLFLTPHIVSSDDDMDKLREAVKEGSDLLKEVPVGARIIPKVDTLTIKPDTSRRPDSLRTLRPRPPATPPDSLPVDTLAVVILSARERAEDLLSRSVVSLPWPYDAKGVRKSVFESGSPVAARRRMTG
jgi:type II secretory pathway component GspD/PulD (secretin)